MSFFRSGSIERRSFPEPIVPPYLGATITGNGSAGTPSIDTALQQSAVWACTRLVADVVSMMECHAYTFKAGQRVPADDPAILRNPSADATFSEWIYMLVVSAMLRGNAVGRKVRVDSYGYPLQVELYNPDQVSPGMKDGRQVYRVGGEDIPKGDVAHFRAFRLPGSAWGLSPIKYAALAINREHAIQQFAYGYFTDAPHPSAMFLADGAISQPEADTLKRRVMAKLSGREPVFLGGGIKYQPLSVSPEESQFLATQKLGVAEIARIYGVPPEMIAAEAGNSMTYANVEQRGIDFLTYSIQPWLSKIEAFLSSMMPGQTHARFDPSVLLRTDLKTRIEATAIGIASKQLTPDEARAMGDLPPLTEPQKKILELVPLTVSPVGRPSKVPPGAQPIADLTPGTPTEGAPA